MGTAGKTIFGKIMFWLVPIPSELGGGSFFREIQAPDSVDFMRNARGRENSLKVSAHEIYRLPQKPEDTQNDEKESHQGMTRKPESLLIRLRLIPVV